MPDELSADVMAAASMAAFPGLPDGMPLAEADRRVAAAVKAAWPLMEQRMRRAIESELAELWCDLDRRQQDAINGAWSLGCVNVAERIEVLTRATGVPLGWRDVQLRILMNGLYETLYEAMGFHVEAPRLEMIDTWRKIREDDCQSTDTGAVEKALNRDWRAHFNYTPVGDHLDDEEEG